MNKSYYKSCGRKIRYRSETDVLRALKSCRRKRGQELDYYYCDHCGGWHLTSRLDFNWDEYEKEPRR